MPSAIIPPLISLRSPMTSYLLKHHGYSSAFPYLIWQLVVWSLEMAMAPHSSTLAWKIPWMEKPGGLRSMGSLRVGHDWATSFSLFTFMHWRNGNPLQCSCLENPRAEPGGLPSMGSHRVGHDWSDLAAAAAVWSSPSFLKLLLVSYSLHDSLPPGFPCISLATPFSLLHDSICQLLKSLLNLYSLLGPYP